MGARWTPTTICNFVRPVSRKLRSLVKETKISIREHHPYAGGPGTTLTQMTTARQRTPHLPPVTMKKRKVPGEDGETKLPSSNGSPVEPSNNIQLDSFPLHRSNTNSGFQIYDYEGNLLPKDTPFKMPNKRTKRALTTKTGRTLGQQNTAT